MPATHAGRDRQHRDKERAQGREGEQQQRDDERPSRRAARRSTSALMCARESTREACRRPTPAAAGPAARSPRSAPRSCRQRVLLAVEVGAVGLRRCQQQRARRRARDPDAVLALRRAGRRQRFGDARRLAGRVAKEDRLQQRSGRRAEERERVVDRLAQAGDAEARRVDGRAQQVAMLEHEAARLGPGAAVAVVDRGEQPARAQGRGQSPRRLGARRACGAFVAPAGRPRCRRAPGARRRRSSADRAGPPARASAPTAGTPTGRRRSGRAQRERQRGGDAGEPDRDRERAAAGRCARRCRIALSGVPRVPAAGSIVITERSPSASSTCTSRASDSRPETRTEATWPRRRMSRGTSSSAQRSALPLTEASNRRSSASRLPVSVPRIASTITAASGERVELHRAAAIADAHRQRVAVDGELLAARLQGLAHEDVGRRETRAGPTTSSVRSSISMRRVR